MSSRRGSIACDNPQPIADDPDRSIPQASTMATAVTSATAGRIQTGRVAIAGSDIRLPAASQWKVIQSVAGA
jgi:hypothetical protein